MKLIEEPGVIVALDEAGGAWVEAAGDDGCGGCAASGHCGTAILGEVLGRQPRRVRVDNPASFPAGTRVVLGIAPQALLHGAVLTYLLPVGGLLVGAGLGAVAGLGSDLAALAGGAAGLFSFLRLGRWLARRRAHALCPQLLRRES